MGNIGVQTAERRQLLCRNIGVGCNSAGRGEFFQQPVFNGEIAPGCLIRAIMPYSGTYSLLMF